MKLLLPISGLLLAGIASIEAAPTSAAKPRSDPAPVSEPRPPADETRVDLEVGFASNYVWRGADRHSDRARQAGRSFGSSTGAAAFQPGIEIHTPLPGLSFRMRGSFAVEGRQDQDTDRVLQTFPAGPDLLRDKFAPDDQLNTVRSAAESANRFQDYPDCSPNCLPNYYREENGLARADELLLVVRYEFRTPLGLLGGGLMSHALLDASISAAPLNELFVRFGTAGAWPIYLTAHFDLGSSDQYHTLSLEPKLDLSASTRIEFVAALAYGIQGTVRGLQHADAGITLFWNNFHVGLRGSHRSDLRFFDGDAQTRQPLWMIGGSTAGDGLVGDPARTNGPTNALVNRQIESLLAGGRADYTYTPRSRLPRWLFVARIGYTHRLM